MKYLFLVLDFVKYISRLKSPVRLIYRFCVVVFFFLLHDSFFLTGATYSPKNTVSVRVLHGMKTEAFKWSTSHFNTSTKIGGAEAQEVAAQVTVDLPLISDIVSCCLFCYRPFLLPAFPRLFKST